MEFFNRVSLTIWTPEGKKKQHKAYRVFVGPNRVTWIDPDGVRHYVLLRHGFTYLISNI